MAMFLVYGNTLGWLFESVAKFRDDSRVFPALKKSGAHLAGVRIYCPIYRKWEYFLCSLNRVAQAVLAHFAHGLSSCRPVCFDCFFAVIVLFFFCN